MESNKITLAVQTLLNSRDCPHSTSFGFGTVETYRGRCFISDSWQTVLVFTSFDFDTKTLALLLEKLHHHTPIYLACLDEKQIKSLRPFFRKHGYFPDLENNSNCFYRVGGCIMDRDIEIKW